MKITLVGYTVAVNLDAFDAGWAAGNVNTDWGPDNNEHGQDNAQLLLEAAGRACYQSWRRPNPQTATNEKYLANILDHEHYSVLEHGVATFYITGVSRSFSHEMIRHRHLSPSELSQRFVDVEHFNLIAPPAIPQEFVENADYVVEGVWNLRQAYRAIVDHLLAKGATRKQAREAARCVMPNMTETRIVLTGNVRAWRDVILKRATIHADREIRAVTVEVFRQLVELWPYCFQDMELHIPDGHLAVRMKEKNDEVR